MLYVLKNEPCGNPLLSSIPTTLSAKSPLQSPVFSLHRALVFGCIFVIGWASLWGVDAVVAASHSEWQDAKSESANQELPDGQIENVSIGFDGRWCLGKWVPFRFETSVTGVQTVELETLDGDGVPVQYRFDFDRVSKKTDMGFRIETLVRVGRESSYLTVRLLEDGDGVLAERRFRLNANDGLPVPQASTTHLALSFGSDINVDSFIGSSRAGVRDRIAMHFDNPDALPESAQALEAVKLVVIVADGIDDVATWSDAQVAAIKDWVKQGGHLLISVRESADVWLGADGKIKDLLAGRYNSGAQVTRADELEKYTSGNSNRLIPAGSDPLKIAQVQFDSSTENDVVQNRMTLIARRAYGFGRVTWVMFDLDDSRIAKWNGRNALIARLLEADAISGEESEEVDTSSASQIGFSDLSGQLRTPLDQYAEVGFINFTTVAVLVVVYILLIGPGDYFFLKYVIRRMQWTWVSFTVITLLFCGIAFFLFSANKPTEIRVNHVELVDVDMQTGAVRGTIWTQIYSPQTGAHDVSLPEQNKFGMALDHRSVTWQGLPGSSLGGMKTLARSSLFQSPYLANDGESSMDLENVPIQVASSKPLLGHYQSKLASDIDGDLQFDPVVTQLTGRVVNPLDVELTNCAVFYKNFLIPIDFNLAPGEEVDISLGNQQDFQSFIKRRVSTTQNKENEIKEVNTKWDKEDTNIPRILRMMMFFDAAGGRGYTELTNDYYDRIDMSRHLDLNRAMLIGRVKSATTPVQVDGKAVSKNIDKKWTVVRVLFPVEEVRK